MADIATINSQDPTAAYMSNPGFPTDVDTEPNTSGTHAPIVLSAARHGSQQSPPNTEVCAPVTSSTNNHESQPHPPPETEALVVLPAGGHNSQPQWLPNTGTHTSINSPAIERGSPPGSTDREGNITKFISKTFKRGSGNGSKPQSGANASESLGANLLKKMELVKRVGVDDLSDQDIIIAVMGSTGAGKSSFINMVTGEERGYGVGHSLVPCTTGIRIIKYSCPERNDLDVVFVDTPGFDNTYRTDMEILEMIAQWLQKTYERNVKLSGILYFHRISDNRMTWTPLKNLRMFEQLCGENGLSKIMLVTTMWDDVVYGTGIDGRSIEGLRERSRIEKEIRERELQNHYWKGMIKRGARVARYFNNQDSAWSVISTLLDDVRTRYAVLLQEELVDMKRELSETHAAKALYDTLYTLLKKQQETMKKIRKETGEKDSKVLLDVLRGEYEGLRKDLDKTLEAMQVLELPLGKRFVKHLTTPLGLSKPPDSLSIKARVQQDTQKVDEEDIVVIILGPAGAGKSSFIDAAVNGTIGSAAQGLSCLTSSVTSVKCDYPGDGHHKIVFVDTPAINHDRLSSADTEMLFAQWMKQSHVKNGQVAGILYLQRISDFRVTESPLRHIRTFSKMCEGDKLKAVVVTTMWDHVSDETGKDREKQIQENYLDTAGTLVPRMIRYDHSPASAWKAVDLVLEE